MAIWKCNSCGTTKESRCKPKKCPSCGKENTMEKEVTQAEKEGCSKHKTCKKRKS